MKKLLKKINNQRGDAYISFLIIITVTAIIGTMLLPSFDVATKTRSNVIINTFNSTDTIVNAE